MSHYKTFTDEIPELANPLFLHKNISQAGAANHFASLDLDRSPAKNYEQNSEGLPSMRVSHFQKSPVTQNISEFQQFEKEILIEKFQSFVSWVQGKKEDQKTEFYEKVKKFEFYRYRSIKYDQNSGVTCLAIDLKGERLAIGCEDNFFSIWDVSNSKEPKFKQKSDVQDVKPSCLLFTEKYLFVGTYNKDSRATSKITQWSYQDNLVKKNEFEGRHHGSIRGLAATNDYLLSVAEDKHLVFWRLNIDFPEKATVKVHDGPVSGVALAEKNKIIVTSGYDMKVKLWDFENLNEPIAVLEGHTEIIRVMAISHDGNKLATGGSDKHLRIWDIKKKEEYHTFEGHTDSIRSLCFSPDGVLIMSGSEDRTIRIWNVMKKKFLAMREGHENSVRALVMDKNGHQIFTGSADKTLMVWTLDHETERDMSFDEKKNKIDVIATLSKPALAITGGSEGSVRVWDTKHGREQQLLEQPGKRAILALDIYNDQDDILFASGDDGGTIVIWSWSLVACNQLSDYKIHTLGVTCIQFSHDGSIIISGSLDKKVNFYERVNGNKKRCIDVGQEVTCLDFDSKERWLVIGTIKGLLKIYSLNEEIKPSLYDIPGHAAKVTGLRITPDGFLVISGSLDCTIRVWNREQNSLTFIITEHKKAILCLDLNYDASKILSGSEDCSLRLWEIDRGTQIGITFFEAEVNALSAPKDGSKVISTGGKKRSLKMTEFNKCRTMYLFEVDRKKIRAIAISPDERYMACASKAPKIRIWDLKTNECLFELEGHAQEVNSVKFTPDGKKLVSCGSDNTIRLWDIWDIQKRNFPIMLRKNTKAVMNIALYEEGSMGIFPLKSESVLICNLIHPEIIEIIRKIPQTNGSVQSVAINEYETHCFFGAKGIIEVYDMENWEMINAFKAHNGKVNTLVIQGNEQRLISAGSDCCIKVWSIEDLEMKLVVTLTGHASEIRDLALNSLGTKLYSASADKSIFIWDLNNYKKVATLEGSTGAVNSLYLMKNGRKLYSGCTDGYIRVWNLNDARKFPFLEGHSAPITRIALTPDGEKLLSVGKDSYVIIWDLKEYKQKAVLRGHKSKFLTGLAISSDGLRAFSSSYEDDEILIWDLKNESLLEILKNESPSVSLILTPNDKFLIAGCCDSFIRVFSLKTKKIIAAYEGHYGNLRCLVLTKDLTTLISGGDDKFIKLWPFDENEDSQSQNYPEWKRTLEGHKDGVMALALSEDNQKLYSGGLDKLVIIWNLSTGKQIDCIEGIANPVRTIQLTPNEDKIIVGCLSKEKPGNYLYVFNSKNLKDPPHICKDKTDRGNPGCYKILLAKDQQNFIASCSNNQISFWSLSDYKITHRLKGFSRKITAEIMTSDKETLVFATDDHSINVWDLRKIKLLALIDGFHGHQDIITSLAVMPKTNKNDSQIEGLRVVSGSKDKTIMIWLILSESYKRLFVLQGHTGPVNAVYLYMAPSEEFIISASNDQTIRTWMITDEGKQYNVITTSPSTVYDLALFKNGYIITGGNSKSLILWDLKKKKPIPQCVAILNSTIKRVCLSPDEKILIVYLESSIMQIWDSRNPEMICPIKELPLKAGNFRTLPAFLSNKNNRLMRYFEKLIDCFTGEVIFQFEPNEAMESFFYDFKNNKFFYTTSGFELHQYSRVWFSTFLYNFLNFDSLTALKMNADFICSRPGSTFPFFFSFLHLIAIFDKSDYFDLNTMQEMYGGKVRLTHFYNQDIFQNTPLDILMMKKNTSLIIKYFNMMFHYFTKKDTTFYEKTRFLTYNFKEDSSILKLFEDLIQLSALDSSRDLNHLSTLLENAFIPFDPSIYDNSLVFSELSEPVIIETDALYNNDHYFIEEKLTEKLKGKKLSENKSIVKAKIICVPGLCNIFNPLTDKIYSDLADIESGNDIFSNEALAILTHYIWDSQIKIYYKVELCVFVTFFLLFNFNFIYLYPLRANMYQNSDLDYNVATIVVDSILFCYGIFCMVNEFIQMFESGVSSYFKSIWNYFDIFLIPLLLSSSLLDISLIFFDYGHWHNLTKLVFASTMFFFWFRFISYFRAIKETSSMIRLIFNVISAVKYFVLFMLLFLITLTTTFYCLHNDHPGKNPRLFETFLVFYTSTVGDSTGISDYDGAYPPLNDYFMILSTLLFAIILLNLLVSLISDKHGDIKDAEEKTRLYELINILVDTNCSLTTQISKLIFKPRKVGEYLIYLSNEKREVLSNQFELLERKLEEKMKKFQSKNENLIEGKTEIMEKIIHKEMENLKIYIKLKLEGNGSPVKTKTKAVTSTEKQKIFPFKLI